MHAGFPRDGLRGRGHTAGVHVRERRRNVEETHRAIALADCEIGLVLMAEVEARAEAEQRHRSAHRLMNQRSNEIGRTDAFVDPDLLMLQAEGRDDVPSPGEPEDTFREDRAVPSITRLVQPRCPFMRAERSGDVRAGPLLERRVVVVEDRTEGQCVALAPALAEAPIEALASKLVILQGCRSRTRARSSRSGIESLRGGPELGLTAPAVTQVAVVPQCHRSAAHPIMVEWRDRLVGIALILREGESAGIAGVRIMVVEIEEPESARGWPISNIGIGLGDPRLTIVPLPA